MILVLINPYLALLVFAVELFMIPKTVKNFNLELENTLINKIKENPEFDIKEITTASYGFVQKITHLFFNIPKQIKPVILGNGEAISSVIIFICFLSIISNVNFGADYISNNSQAIGSAAGCGEKRVLKVFEELANKEIAKGLGYSYYIKTLSDIKETGYNPKLDIRMCQVRVELNQISSGRILTATYSTTKDRIELGELY